jgi:hypothetical protein
MKAGPITNKVAFRHQGGEYFKIISKAELESGSLPAPLNKTGSDASTQTTKIPANTICNLVIVEKSAFAIMACKVV